MSALVFESAGSNDWSSGDQVGASPLRDSICEGHGRDGGDGDRVNDEYREGFTGSVDDEVVLSEGGGGQSEHLTRFCKMKNRRRAWKVRCAIGVTVTRTEPGVILLRPWALASVAVDGEHKRESALLLPISLQYGKLNW